MPVITSVVNRPWLEVSHVTMHVALPWPLSWEDLKARCCQGLAAGPGAQHQSLPPGIDGLTGLPQAPHAPGSSRATGEPRGPGARPPSPAAVLPPGAGALHLESELSLVFPVPGLRASTEAAGKVQSTGHGVMCIGSWQVRGGGQGQLHGSARAWGAGVELTAAAELGSGADGFPLGPTGCTAAPSRAPRLRSSSAGAAGSCSFRSHAAPEAM